MEFETVISSTYKAICRTFSTFDSLKKNECFLGLELVSRMNLA